jgi:hypothetical protein
MTKITKQLSAMTYRWFAAMALIAVCSLNAVGQCNQPGGPFQNFESFSATTPTSGGTWTVTSMSYGTTAANIRTGSHYAIFNALGDILGTPQIANPLVFSFWYKRSSTATGTPQFTIETSPNNSTWTVRGTVSTFTTTYQQFTIDLNALGLTNVYVRVRDTRASGTAERYIDDMSWTSTVGANNTIQIGLGSPITIGSLPYSTGTGQTTCGNGNNVTSSNAAVVCGSTNYYSAEDKTYIFTPTTTGVHNILLTTVTDDDAGIQLYQGCPLSGGTCIANSQSTTGLTRTLAPNLTNGVTYYLVVDNWTPPACIGSYSLDINPPVACPIPTAVTAGSITQTTASITWSCTGCSGTYELDYGPNPHIAGTGTIITGVTSPYTLNPPLTPNTSYQVFVRQDCTGGGNGFSNWSSGATFTTLAPPPGNDDCAGAMVIPSTGPFPYTTSVVNNSSATNGSDPIPTCQSSSNKGVWYAFTPSVTGSYTLSTCVSDAPGTTISDGILAVYTAAGPCTAPYTSVACDDDGCVTSTLQSIVTTNLTCGTLYYIVASGYNANVGDIQLKITAPACTANLYTVTGGGTYCAGGSGVTVGLSNSDLCYNYQLFEGANPVGAPLAGTGAALDFGLQTTAGTYTVTATNAIDPSCNATMTGSVGVAIQATPTANAGGNASVCATSPDYTLSGATAANQSSVSWSTAGDGTFDNAALVNATYTPGANDITNGTVVLTLQANATSPCTGSVSSNMTLNIVPVATANAGGNASVCSDATYTLSGATATNQSSVAWSTAGDGTFDNAALVNATYTPGANDITNGTVVLTLQSNATSPCTGFVTSNMTLTIVPAATANAGGNANICASATYTLSGATATNNTGVSWSTAGDGSFTPNNTTLNATYTPGATDISNGTVQLTLTATGNTPCGNAVSNMTLGIEAIPTANAGADANACAAGYVLSGSVGGSATGGTWSTSGDGSFSPNATTLNATYIAGPNDITNGTVALTLTSTGSLYCTAATDNVTLTIIGAAPSTPTAITGAPVSVCPPTGTYTLATTSTGATSFNWYLSPTTNGVNFLTANGTNTIDVNFQATTNSGYTIRVEATNACGTTAYVSAFVRRSTSTPVAVIGPDFACPNDVKTYSHAAVGGATSYQWTAPAGCYFDGNVLNTPPYVTSGTSVTVTFPVGYTGGTIGVASQVACFTSPYKNLIVNNAPSAPSLISGSTSVCSPQAGVAYSVTNTPGLTYTWVAPANATIATGQGTNAVTVNFFASFAGGKLEVAANSACGASLARKLTVAVTSGGGTTPRPSSITGQVANLCGANGVQFTANPFVAGATYTFSSNVPGATLVNTVNNVATFNFPTGWATGSVSVIQQNACATASLPRTVDVKSRPAAPVITGPVNVAPNTSGVAYSVPSLTPAVTYTWFAPAGATIATGQGTNAITVNFGPTGGQVKCFEVNGCGNATGVLNVSVPRLAGGTTEQEDAMSFSIYPNPADNYVTVQFASQTEGNTTVQIVDLMGKVVSLTQLNTVSGINTNTIDVSNLAKGMYLINVQTPDGNLQTRIAVQ